MTLQELFALAQMQMQGAPPQQQPDPRVIPGVPVTPQTPLRDLFAPSDRPPFPAYRREWAPPPGEGWRHEYAPPPPWAGYRNEWAR